MILGGTIGFKREMRARPAGLRMHMLLAGTAALLIALSMPLVEEFGAQINNSILRADPIQVIQAIIIGISFVGAGTIIRPTEENHVEGVTTAATTLAVAVIGSAVALGEVILAVGTTLLILITLRSVRWLEQRKPK